MIVLPNGFLLANYRCFVDTEDITIRPITLLYGRNNAGKSALLRALPLVDDSLSLEGLDALRYRGRLGELDIDYSSLLRKGRSEDEDNSIKIEINWPQEADLFTRAKWVFRQQHDWCRTIVSRFSLSRDGTADDLFSAEWKITKGEERARWLTYDVASSWVDGGEAQILWRGMHPELRDYIDEATFSALENRLGTLSRSVLWLRSLRPPPSRYTSRRGAVEWSMCPSGLDASLILHSNPGVFSSVSAWYSTNTGYNLSVDEITPDSVATRLRSRDNSSFGVDMLDTGEGLSQVMPVLTALAMARSPDGHGPHIIAVEEPEAHLHPDLQQALMDEICLTAGSGDVAVVAETHSEAMILALRLAIVRGDVDENAAVVYWVGLKDGKNVLNEVHINRDGRFIGDWPPDAFKDILNIAADIQDARGEEFRS